MAGVTSEYDLSECPVCEEDYIDPKLLPCGHIICRECVLSWVKANTQHNNCPMCRATIVLHQSPDKTINVDIASLIDNLPTDVAVVAVVECKQLLKGNHVCNVCDDDSPAASICIDCNIKLCAPCSRTHRKFPAFLEHCLEQLSTLTPERLAALRKSFCDVHKNRPAELYCPTDQSLICFLCSSSSHRSCAGVQALADFAKNERQTFKVQIDRLRQMKNAIEKQMKQLDIRASDVQSQTEALKHNVNVTIDGLKAALDRRRQELHANIDSEKDGVLNCLKTEILSVKGCHTSLAAHIYAAERLLNIAADGSLLSALPNLKTSMAAIQQQENSADDNRSMPEIRFDPETITNLESVVSTFGQLVFISTETTVRMQKPASFGSLAALRQTLLTTAPKAVTIDKDQMGMKLHRIKTDGGINKTVYYSSVCEDNKIDHHTGILSYEGSPSLMPISQFIGKRPLDAKCNKFSIEIVSEGDTCIIGIGLCHRFYPSKIMAGWGVGSVGYHSDDGGIFIGLSQTKLPKSKCKEHDVMSVEVDFSTQSLSFCKNNCLEFKTSFLQIPDCGFYPIVNLKSPGGAVRLLEREPWRPD